MTETIDAADHPKAIEAPEAPESEEQPQRVRGADALSRAAAPWWTRSRLNDPDGDPTAEAEHSELLERTVAAEPADAGRPPVIRPVMIRTMLIRRTRPPRRRPHRSAPR